jgi:hypothetical protein
MIACPMVTSWLLSLSIVRGTEGAGRVAWLVPLVLTAAALAFLYRRFRSACCHA